MHPRSTPTRLPRWGPRPGCVAPRSNTPGILGRRALPSGRLARLGATPDFRHGLLAAEAAENAEKHFPARSDTNQRQPRKHEEPRRSRRKATKKRHETHKNHELEKTDSHRDARKRSA